MKTRQGVFPPQRVVWGKTASLAEQVPQGWRDCECRCAPVSPWVGFHRDPFPHPSWAPGCRAGQGNVSLCPAREQQLQGFGFGSLLPTGGSSRVGRDGVTWGNAVPKPPSTAAELQKPRPPSARCLLCQSPLVWHTPLCASGAPHSLCDLPVVPFPSGDVECHGQLLGQ